MKKGFNLKVYFDNAATTKLHPKVFEKMIPFLNEEYGNPSSIHSYGRKVRVAVEEAREVIANFIKADASEIYFVSNGTEANNFPIFGIAKTLFEETGKNKIITSSVEHTCVLESFEVLEKNGFSKLLVGVNEEGKINVDDLRNKIDDKTSLISVIHANNESGALNDLKSIGKILSPYDVYFHSDAVQSFGKIKIDVKELGVDSLSVSAHKIHGPKGVGAVYAKSGTPLSPMIFGGSQERNRRGGTEFTAGIVGFAEAVKIAEQESEQNFEIVEQLRNYFIKSLDNSNIPHISINCRETSFPFILSLTFDGKYYRNDSEAMLMYLDINGIAASNGAACTSGTLKPSHVILNMGRSREDAMGTIRFSFSALNTNEEVDYTIDKLQLMSKKFLR